MTFRWMSTGVCVYTQIWHWVIMFPYLTKRSRWEQCFQRWAYLCVCVSELLGLPSVLTLACHPQNQEHIPPILSVALGAALTYKDFLSDPCVLSAQWRTIPTRRSIRSVIRKREPRNVGRGPQTPNVVEKRSGLDLVKQEGTASLVPFCLPPASTFFILRHLPIMASVLP